MPSGRRRCGTIQGAMRSAAEGERKRLKGAEEPGGALWASGRP